MGAPLALIGDRADRFDEVDVVVPGQQDEAGDHLEAGD
jgi:hypothetical protein